MPGSKRWCYTINNPCVENLRGIMRITLDDDLIWMNFQWERGVTGTVHIQGAVYFASRITEKKLQNYLTGLTEGDGTCACRAILITQEEIQIFQHAGQAIWDSDEETAETEPMSDLD